MPQTTDQLKPCPFCGGNPTVDAQFGREWWVECDDCAATTGGMEATKAEAIAAWNRRAVSLVAEAPREPVAWRDCWGDPHRTRQAAINSDDSEEPPPLYAALPASLAPMPEECSVSQWSSRCCERGTKGCTVSHLRTAPRPTLSDEQIEFTDSARGALLWVLWHHQGGSSAVGQPIRFALGMGQHERLSGAQVAEAKRWDALMSETARAKASASPQQPEQKPDSFHLAANRESAVHGLDAAAGVQEVPRG
jgi:Lar family restriction alleviation protein